MASKIRIYWFDTINHPLFTDYSNSYQGAAEVWTAEETSPGVWGAKSLVWDSFADPPASPSGFVAGGYGQPNATGSFFGGCLANLGGGAITEGQAGNIGLLLTLINQTDGHTYLYSLPNSSAPPPVSATPLSSGGPFPVGLGGNVVGGEFKYNGYWWIATRGPFSGSPTTATINIYSSPDRITWTVQDTIHALVSRGFCMTWSGVDALLRFASTDPVSDHVELIEFTMGLAGAGTWGNTHDPITTVGTGATPSWIAYDPATGNTAVICSGGNPVIVGAIWLANFVSGSWTNVGSPACDQSLKYQVNSSSVFFEGLLTAALDPTDGITIHSIYDYNDSNYDGTNLPVAFNNNRYAYSRCAGGTTSHTFQFDPSVVGTTAANKTGLLNSAALTSSLLITSDGRLLVAVAYRKTFNTGPIIDLIGSIATAVSDNNGSGYAPGDQGFINTGDGSTEYTVSTIGPGGSVATFTFNTFNLSSTGYALGDGQATYTTTGSGDGNFTVNVTAITSSYGSPDLSSVAVHAPGTSYSLGDQGTVIPGTEDLVYTVTSEGGGLVNAVSLTTGSQNAYPGQQYYSTLPATGFGGGNCELIFTITPYPHQATTVPAVWSADSLTAPSWTLVTVDTAAGDNVTAAILQFDVASAPTPVYPNPTRPPLCPPLNNALINQPYSSFVRAVGGTPSYTYVITSGALPTGLALNNATGLISGTPTVTGTFNFTVKSIDANGNSALSPCVITISNCPDAL